MIYAIIALSLFVIVLLYLTISATKKLLRYDELFQLLYTDIEINIKYFNRLLKTPLLCNEPEVIAMQKNIKIMAVRLDEFVNQIEDLTGNELRQKKEQNA
jgi:hypothetical protein